MKKILLLCTLLSGCYSDNSSIKNPNCVDGYLVYNINGRFQGFCLKVYSKSDGLSASGCFDGPPEGPRVQMNLIMLEGYYAKTKCYNTLSSESHAK